MATARVERIVLEVVTPRRAVLMAETGDVTLPGIDGEMEILPGHRPLLTALRPGKLVAEVDGKTLVYFIRGGFAEILPNAVAILADEAELDTDIDLKEARERLRKAEAQLDDHRLLPADERESYQRDVECARVRVGLAEGLAADTLH
jgi:F-type H+-transporting ATPase subunit epsilon